MSKVLKKNYDLQGLEIFRVVKIALISKILPIGNFATGPGVRFLIILSLLHHFGYPIYLLLARFGQRVNILRQISARLRP
ncbi:hypothetical protein ABF87_04360 [Nitrosomonas sp. JL21]|uniref:hypothetical protein n=1 Tax=Nitrosomonas sp. JL21 TaxID=153949 RepID=UPI00136A8730|nr:hypothetical protein [Nitrosomonas sp. JL21]MBL8498185.1 hypothetical protein [Nitrosomonas sp.]MXS77205.1 hypothetical protein [Nitrosomonas sp. JL21]